MNLESLNPAFNSFKQHMIASGVQSLRAEIKGDAEGIQTIGTMVKNAAKESFSPDNLSKEAKETLGTLKGAAIGAATLGVAVPGIMALQDGDTHPTIHGLGVAGLVATATVGVGAGLGVRHVASLTNRQVGMGLIGGVEKIGSKNAGKLVDMAIGYAAKSMGAPATRLTQLAGYVAGAAGNAYGVPLDRWIKDVSDGKTLIEGVIRASKTIDRFIGDKGARQNTPSIQKWLNPPVP